MPARKKNQKNSKQDENEIEKLIIIGNQPDEAADAFYKSTMDNYKASMKLLNDKTFNTRVTE